MTRDTLNVQRPTTSGEYATGSPSFTGVTGFSASDFVDAQSIQNAINSISISVSDGTALAYATQPSDADKLNRTIPIQITSKDSSVLGETCDVVVTVTKDGEMTSLPLTLTYVQPMIIDPQTFFIDKGATQEITVTGIADGTSAEDIDIKYYEFSSEPPYSKVISDKVRTTGGIVVNQSTHTLTFVAECVAGSETAHPQTVRIEIFNTKESCEVIGTSSVNPANDLEFAEMTLYGMKDPVTGVTPEITAKPDSLLMTVTSNLPDTVNQAGVQPRPNSTELGKVGYYGKWDATTSAMYTRYAKSFIHDKDYQEGDEYRATATLGFNTGAYQPNVITTGTGFNISATHNSVVGNGQVDITITTADNYDPYTELAQAYPNDLQQVSLESGNSMGGNLKGKLTVNKYRNNTKVGTLTFDIDFVPAMLDSHNTNYGVEWDDEGNVSYDTTSYLGMGRICGVMQTQLIGTYTDPTTQTQSDLGVVMPMGNYYASKNGETISGIIMPSSFVHCTPDETYIPAPITGDAVGVSWTVDVPTSADFGDSGWSPDVATELDITMQLVSSKSITVNGNTYTLIGVDNANNIISGNDYQLHFRPRLNPNL